MNQVSQNLQNENWKKIVDQLVIENCLAFGDDSKLTQKKVARYLLGTRATFEIFKLYELRYLLLRVYPFIQNLFYNPRLNSTLKIKKLWNKNYQKQIETQRKLGVRLPSNEWKPRVRIINSFVQKEKNLTPQVLFATVTPTYTEIIKSAAQICNMPSHENRWLNGSITAAISYKEDYLRWNYITDETQAKIRFHSTKKWGSNKENAEKTKEKLKYHGESRWPSLIIVPDLSNNIMIIKEAKKVGLPVIGLVNSSTSFQIDYPIFAQEQTLQSVHFFCHFLATLIAKEAVYIQHKRYILQKKKRKLKNKELFKTKTKKNQIILKNNLKNKFFEQLKFQPEPSGLNQNLKRRHLMQSKSRHKPFWKNTVFFRIVKPTNDWKVPDTEWHTEYMTLKSKGRYFSPRFKFRFRKTSYKNRFLLPKKKSPLGRIFRIVKTSSKVLNKNKKKKKNNSVFKKRFFKVRSLPKVLFRFKSSLLPFRGSLPKGLIIPKGHKIYVRNHVRMQVNTKKSFRHLRLKHFVKIVLRYLQRRKQKKAKEKKKNSMKILKQQKYLSFILNLKKRLGIKARSTRIWHFLKQEVCKKHFNRKTKSFLIVSEQRQLWKNLHTFLTSNKILNLQLKNKFLRFQKARFHTEYKSYYALGLRQWQQTMRFKSPKHDFAALFNDRSYKTRLAEAQYYYAHPAEWKAEKARLYYNRSISKNFKKRHKDKHNNQYNNQYQDKYKDKYKNQHKNQYQNKYKDKFSQEKQKGNWGHWTEKNTWQQANLKRKNEYFSRKKTQSKKNPNA